MFYKLLCVFCLGIFTFFPADFAFSQVENSEDKSIVTDFKKENQTEDKSSSKAEKVVFPPIQQETSDKKMARLQEATEQLKTQFVSYMEETPERREVLQELTKAKDTVISYWNDFSQDPRAFLKGNGINDERILSIAESLFANNDFVFERDTTGSVKMFSCKTETNGTVLNDISFTIAKDYILLDDEISPLKIIFENTKNIKDLSFNPTFQRTFIIDGKERKGYAKTADFPFSFKAENPALPVEIKVVLKGTFCKKDQCKPLDAALEQTFSVNNKLSSLECNYIKSKHNDYHNPRDIDISGIFLNDEFLKFSADIPYKNKEFRIIVTDLNKDNPIFFSGNELTSDGKRTKIITYIDKKKTPAENLFNLDKRTFSVKFGYADYFTEATISTADNNTLETVKISPFKTGILLSFFSPLLILLMYILHKNQWRYTVLVTAQTACTIAIVYPLLHIVCPEWGMQFASRINVYLGLVSVFAVTVALLKLPNFKSAGIIFALLPIILPCNYLADIFNHGTVKDFIISAFGIIITFLTVFSVKKYIAAHLPKPLEEIIQLFNTENAFRWAIFVPVILLTLLSLFLIFLQIKIWAFVVFFLLFLIAVKSLQTGLNKKDDSSFYLSTVITVAAIIPLLFTETATKDNLTQASLQNAIRNDKIVYVYADTKWCLSCQAGRIFFLNSTLISSMVKSGKMVVMPADENNPVLKDFRRAFDLPQRPLNILYSKTKPYGELLPTFVQNYEARNYINAVYRPKSNSIF